MNLQRTKIEEAEWGRGHMHRSLMHTKYLALTEVSCTEAADSHACKHLIQTYPPLNNTSNNAL